MDFFLILQGRGKNCAPFFLSIHQLIFVDCFPFPHLKRTYEESKILFYLLSVTSYVYPELSFVLTTEVVIKLVQTEEAG